MRLEDQLRRALRRELPPADFTDRVAARVESRERQSPPPFFSTARRGLIALGTAAMIAIASGSTLYYVHRKQIAEAERVRMQALVGLRIASGKLNEVHDRLFPITNQNERPR